MMQAKYQRIIQAIMHLNIFEDRNIKSAYKQVSTSPIKLFI